MKIKLNYDLRKHKKNDIIEIAVDENNVPIDRYWRNRLRDSKIDNCVTIKKRSYKKLKSTT